MERGESIPELAGVRPVGDQLWVLPDPPQERTREGVIIPARGVSDDPTNFRAPCTGLVAAVGPGAYTKQLAFVRSALHAGERVLFSRFAGMDRGISYGGTWYRVMHECDIQAVVGDDFEPFRFNELTA